MKKILSIALLLMLFITLQAQENVTKFLGIPVAGTKSAMIQKIKNKGFQYNYSRDCLEGEFNGTQVRIFVVTNNNKVWRIAITDAVQLDEINIRIRFNTLCKQFENNKKYVNMEIDQTIPEDEDILHQMLVDKKRYEAAYYQLPIDTNLAKRSVWFMINEEDGEYRIQMFYDNEFNHSNGEDL